jgi:phage nucleotide-binding protein
MSVKAMPLEPDLRQLLGVVKPGHTEWVNVFIFGDPKVGKTQLVSTAQDHPDTAPLLLFDVEGGTTTIRDRGDIDVVEIRSIDQFTRKVNELQKLGDNLSEYYRTLAVDNMSELQALDLIPIMKEAHGKNPERVDIDVPGQREWGKTREHMRKIARALRDLPCNLIITAHVNTVERDGQPAKHYPGFGGKAKSDVAGFMDIVGYMTMVQDKGKEAYTRVQFRGTRQVLAGDRFNILGDTMDNATFPEIWHKIKGVAG